MWFFVQKRRIQQKTSGFPKEFNIYSTGGKVDFCSFEKRIFWVLTGGETVIKLVINRILMKFWRYFYKIDHMIGIFYQKIKQKALPAFCLFHKDER